MLFVCASVLIAAAFELHRYPFPEGLGFDARVVYLAVSDALGRVGAELVAIGLVVRIFEWAERGGSE